MNINEIQAKSIITKSKLPDTDYVVNPYIGCQFACLYCYASFMGRFVNESLENWGNYLYVKANAAELFKVEYKRLKSINNKSPSIMLSSVTDPYQGVEMCRTILKSHVSIFPNVNQQLTRTIAVLHVPVWK